MSMPSFSLEDKVAIVTGGGSGIGRGIALRFAEAGANVIVASRRLSVLKKVAEELKALGRRSLAIQTDVSQRGDVDNLIQTVMAEFERVDILVNNAGIAYSVPFIEMTDDLRDRIWDINMKGVWDCTKAVIPSMIKQKYGKIINISSVTGPMVSGKGLTAYSASKGAVSGFTRALALEVARYGINVNAICPGYVDTPMLRPNSAKMGTDPNDFIKKFAKSIPLGRLGSIEEIGDLAVFLASEASKYITGTEIVFDGGSIIQEYKG